MTSQILIADDDRLVLVTLAKGLRHAGFEVLEATDGDEAVQLCHENQPDLAILDIRMPGTSGIETARILRQQHAIPFLIFSAYGDDDLIRQAVTEGALGYLVKPLDMQQIIPAVHTALERSQHINKLQTAETHLTRALNGNRATSTAVGILMERYQLDNQAAFEMLRRQARSQRRKISALAAEIIASIEHRPPQSPPGS